MVGILKNFLESAMNSVIFSENYNFFGIKSRILFIIIMIFMFAGCHRSETVISTPALNEVFDLSPAEIELFTEEAKQGDIEAAEKLALYYDMVELDSDKAAEFMRIPAKLGVARWQYNIACLLVLRSSLKEQQEGIYWYEISAKDGYVKSQVRLAELYERGKIVEQDYCKAQYWYEKAARLGDVRSMVILSEFIETGECDKCDNIEAYTWLLVALNQEKQIDSNSFIEKNIKEKIVSFENQLSDSDIKRANEECDMLIKEIEDKKPKEDE
jgi:hypothetical protein